jgi:hypothetical protein
VARESDREIRLRMKTNEGMHYQEETEDITKRQVSK